MVWIFIVYFQYIAGLIYHRNEKATSEEMAIQVYRNSKYSNPFEMNYSHKAVTHSKISR